jgi:hypothetical protein
MLGQIIANPGAHRLTHTQMERAWNYAYRFFFEFPRPFPWHLVHMWDDYQAHPLESVLSPEGMQQYGETFQFLTGEPMDWTRIGIKGS